jgi:hypothetical protein
MVGSQDDEEPQAAVDSAGDAIVVWEHWDGTNFVVQAALRPAGAANFTLLPNPVSVPQSQPHEDAIGPKVAVDPTGDAVVVWKLGGGPSGNAWKVQAAELPAGGATFTAPQDMSAAGEDAEDPAVAIDNAGNAVAIWQRFDTSGAFIDTASLAAGTSSWNKSELPAMINSLVPDIAVDPAGNALGVWAGPDSVNSSIYSAFRPAGGAFEAPLPLSTAGQNAVDPHVVLDQTGDAFAVWERSDGHNTIATAYLPTPPPTGPPIPPLPPPGGCTPHPGLPCPPGQPQPQPPRLLSLRLTPGTFSAAGRLVHGHCVRPMATNRANRRCTRAVTLKVSLVLPAAATVAFTVQRAMTGHLGHHRCITNRRGNAHGHRCTRFVTLSGSVSRHGHTGANTFVYRHRALTPGSYRLLATPSIGGQIGTAAVVPFKVVS